MVWTIEIADRIIATPLEAIGTFDATAEPGGDIVVNTFRVCWALVGGDGNSNTVGVTAVAGETTVILTDDNRSIRVNLLPKQEQANGALCAVVFLQAQNWGDWIIAGFLPIHDGRTATRIFTRLPQNPIRVPDMLTGGEILGNRSPNHLAFRTETSPLGNAIFEPQPFGGVIVEGVRVPGGFTPSYRFAPAFTENIPRVSVTRITTENFIAVLMGTGNGIRLNAVEQEPFTNAYYPIQFPLP